MLNQQAALRETLVDYAYRRGRGQSQVSRPADITRLVATGSTAAVYPSTA